MCDKSEQYVDETQWCGHVKYKFDSKKQIRWIDC